MNAIVAVCGVLFELSNGRELFNNLNFSLDSKLIALVGRNGVGKTCWRNYFVANLSRQTRVLCRESAVKTFTCPLEDSDATDGVALRGVRSYVVSLPSGRDPAGTERAADRTCETCQRRSFQN
jgi:ATPase subunit of ABC transporter with duplicated ATPase domains